MRLKLRTPDCIDYKRKYCLYFPAKANIHNNGMGCKVDLATILKGAVKESRNNKVEIFGRHFSRPKQVNIQKT